MVLSSYYKIEYGKLSLKPSSSSDQLIGINIKLTYYTNFECVAVTKKMKVCYVWVYNQEAIKSAVFCGTFRVLDFVYMGSGVTLEGNHIATSLLTTTILLRRAISS